MVWEEKKRKTMMITKSIEGPTGADENQPRHPLWKKQDQYDRSHAGGERASLAQLDYRARYRLDTCPKGNSHGMAL